MLNLFASLENMQPQTKQLHGKITSAIEAIRSQKTFDTESIRNSGIMETVKYHTNMSVDFLIDEKLGINAYAMMPSVDHNHFYFDDSVRSWVGNDTGKTLINFLEKEPKGWIVPSNCSVGGIFANINTDIAVGMELLKCKMTSGQVAAIILHEVGHIYGYFAGLGVYLRTAIITGAAAKAAMEIEDPKERIVVLKKAERALGIEKVDTSSIANAPRAIRGQAVQTVYLNAADIRARSETGTELYDLRACEQYADRFSTFHGAGVELAGALQFVYRNDIHRATMGYGTHVMLELLKLVVWTAALLMMPVPILCHLLLTNPMLKSYDDPEQRVRMIKQGIIDQLKDQKLPPKLRDNLLADVEAVSQIEDTLNDKMTITELFWVTLMPQGRRALAQQDAQKQIETLLSNELFVKAQQFKAM